MNETAVIPTPEEIRDTFARVRDKISKMYLRLDAVIDDYPIGRRERGKCRLQVERAKGKGYRTVRTTTNKHGNWCAPKKSTYRNAVWVVATHVDGEHDTAWLSVGFPELQYGGTSVFLTYANGNGVTLAKCWRSDPPRRDEKRYTTTWTTSRLVISREGLTPESEPKVEREEHVLAADPPHEIEAWDVWAAELKTVRDRLIAIWNTCEAALKAAAAR
jgi:hypothetical protein